MTREELITKICDKVNTATPLSVKDMECKETCGTSTYQKGLYFLFDGNDKCIYIGKVGDGDSTSLFHRMVGHGNKSHKTCDKRWYGSVVYGKWYKFNVIGKELALLERMAIFGMGQPTYNDVDSDQNAVNNIESLGIL